ncbi:hypothetical protein RHGRI_034077 [Rhododendron griersonianum]|uniref:Uncharacterized protein n=1 Tax=Rhododendron griersonianum TaxID=479676 RepID=A0AAV6HZ42_9ERIC|nr:hypothetical protein RHGRI_034077 [Rhododendron griersonianum]
MPNRSAPELRLSCMVVVMGIAWKMVPVTYGLNWFRLRRLEDDQRTGVQRWEDFPRGVSLEILVDGRYRPPSTHDTCPHPAGWDGTDGDMEQGQARVRAEIHRWHGAGA